MYLHGGAALNIGHSESQAIWVCILLYICQAICGFPSFFFWSATILMLWCFSQSSYHYLRTEQLIHWLIKQLIDKNPELC